MRNRLIVALFGAPAILLVVLVLPAIWTPIAISLLAIVASFEISRALGVTQPRLRLYAMLLAAAIPQCVYWKATTVIFMYMLFLFVLLSFIEALISHYKVNMITVGGMFFFSFFVSYFLTSVVRLVMSEGRVYYVLVPLIIPFMSDSFAMFSGMLFGKHKLAPEISPKKTVEGSLGGIIGATLSILLYGFIIGLVLKPEVNYLYLAIYGLFGAIVSQVGDLSFSYVKRQNKIKDFGTIFPGHGGVLDRFDSVIFCAPFVEILILLIPAFQIG